MTVAQIVLAGGELWVDETMALRYRGPDELIPAIREHKELLRQSVMISEWRRKCLEKAHGSDYGAQWRELANLPTRIRDNQITDDVRRTFIVNWKYAYKDLVPMVGDDLAGLVRRTFATR